MTFVRQPALRWHQEVPGARWFRADLHVHTIDDHAGGRAKFPKGLQCSDLTSPDFLREYARAFLKAAVAANVHVVALTPHAVKTGASPDSSAVWAIVDCWNEDDDDDGVPFREKVYAVFPGFEPSFNVGSEGLHLLFIFDPEIGRDRYLEAFTLIMEAKPPWNGNELTMTKLHAHDAFKRVSELPGHGDTWDHIVLAPHVDSGKGLFKTQKGQVLRLFEHDGIAALEISDNKLPSEIIASKGPWFQDGLHRYRHALYHASDAYKVSATDDPKEFELGHRITWLKLAQPRVEALRQAFLAADSRVAIAYERDSSGHFVERGDAPESVPLSRPWLRRVTVEGGGSFFGGVAEDAPRRVEIPFSPGLTCIVGASMTGKSTLLDGLRLHAGARLPSGRDLVETVRRRGEGLLQGSPGIVLDTPCQTVGALHERWPAVFYTQNELQSLMRADRVVEILAGLAGTRRARLEELDAIILELDAELKNGASELERLVDEYAEADQKKKEANEASDQLKAFEKAGLESLRKATRITRLAEGAAAKADEASKELAKIRSTVEAGTLTSDVMSRLNELAEVGEHGVTIATSFEDVVAALDALDSAIKAWAAALRVGTEAATQEAKARRVAMDQALAAAGVSSEQLANFKSLSGKAELRDSYAQAFEQTEERLLAARDAFEKRESERDHAVEARRALFDEIIVEVAHRFDGNLRVRRIEHALADPLEAFLKGLDQKGITRWWNNLAESNRPAPRELHDALDTESLTSLGASDLVAQRFKESMDAASHYQLRALRSEDRYVFEQQLESGEFRTAEELSGGRRVSLLLSLLLAMDDPSPLVIDQPEDELDNRVLWSTVLPALRSIKGRRQVILVTHNANIVVNGDADLVVQLDATADMGRVARYGAIEQPDMRDAIVDTVDGGRDAFELRKVKYGF